MRYIYSLILYLIAPFIPLYLNKRAKKNPDYALYWSERFGFGLQNNITRPIIWIHAVSVGETRAIAKLVELIESNYPNYQILLTQMTPTGRHTAKTLYPNAHLHYIPYDMPHAVINFYKTFKPALGLIMETEIWPNLIFYAKKFQTPLFLINARLSDRSFNSYYKVRFMMRPILNNLTGILCQDKNSANNFKQLGFNGQLDIIGNTKFDIIIDKKKYNVLAQFLKGSDNKRKIVAFASTRDGEEKLILDALPNNLEYLILIIPRTPERFSAVEELIINKNLKYQKRSDNLALKEDTQVLLGNSLGEMFAYYLMSDIAVIGGSFVDLGGQNLIEPLYLHKPVIFGPSMYNFLQISKDALDINCAIQATNIAECFVLIDKLFKHPTEYQNLSANCNKFISCYQGASQKTINHIKKFL
jgi:3-deoxy-D-manno-octulosonic-acid transferase